MSGEESLHPRSRRQVRPASSHRWSQPRVKATGIACSPRSTSPRRQRSDAGVPQARFGVAGAGSVIGYSEAPRASEFSISSCVSLPT